MKKSIYKKVWLVLSVLCVLVIAASAGAADAPNRPGSASPIEGAAGAALDMMGPNSLTALTAATPTGDLFQDGGDRLTALQNDDGGWDWPLDDGTPATSSPLNTVGPIAQGLAIAYQKSGDPAHLAALQDAGALLLTKTNNFSPSDGYLAAQLDAIFGGTTYVDHVTANFYGPLAAGTYNRNGAGTLYNAAGYVSLIHTARASIPNLAAWDIGMGLVGAASAGADTTAWIAGTKAEIDELDGNEYYDVIGLAGAVYGLSFVSEDFDPTTGEHAAANNLDDLADILASYQIDGGGFAWNSFYVIASDGNETIQETAYAVLALNEVDPVGYANAINGAVQYMGKVQLATGGWENYPGSGENNEITGEALWASQFLTTAVYPLAGDALICDSGTVEIAIDDVANLYGYELVVGYNKDLVEASGSFENGWIDPSGNGFPGPAGWQAECDNGLGQCKFAYTRGNQDGEIATTEPQVIASIDFTSKLPTDATEFDVTINDIKLSDKDSFKVPVASSGSLTVEVCGNATVSGQIGLQGRPQPSSPFSGPPSVFEVKLTGPYGTFSATPDPANGMYTVSGVKFTSSGTDYDIEADHSVYLKAAKVLNVASITVEHQDTTLLGGDATDNGKVGSGDLACVGGLYGMPGPYQCGGGDPTTADLNNDGVVNIQDLVLVAGNYSLPETQGW